MNTELYNKLNKALHRNQSKAEYYSNKSLEEEESGL